MGKSEQAEELSPACLVDTVNIGNTYSFTPEYIGPSARILCILFYIEDSSDVLFTNAFGLWIKYRGTSMTPERLGVENSATAR